MQAQGYGMGALATLVGPVVISLSYSTFMASHLDAHRSCGCHSGATLRPMSPWEIVDANASEAKGSCYGMLTPRPVGLKTTPCRQRAY